MALYEHSFVCKQWLNGNMADMAPSEDNAGHSSAVYEKHTFDSSDVLLDL